MENKNNILFISSVCSPEVFAYILKTSSDNPGIAAQKFHSLLTSGLAGQETNIIETLSTPPITPSINKKRFWKFKTDYYNNVKYNYIFIVNLPVIRNIVVFFYSFFKILFWRSNGDTNKIVICDILKRTAVAGAFMACKLRRIKMIGIVTDIPGLDVFESTFKSRMAKYFALLILTRYDGYIILTNHMNSLVNPKMKPKMIMEGLVDINPTMNNHEVDLDKGERIILYAGGIHERYGIKTLIEAFKRLEEQDLRLDIYGDGPMGKDMPKYIEQDRRIRYYGIVPNEIVVGKQITATLLVNPRPISEEFTKYSFPSKNIEYMSSGTPVVTTLLPGMPDEYLPFVYIFNNETIEGMSITLNNLIKKDKFELRAFGAEAKKFVLIHKNNHEQGRKITRFLGQVLQG